MLSALNIQISTGADFPLKAYSDLTFMGRGSYFLHFADTKAYCQSDLLHRTPPKTSFILWEFHEFGIFYKNATQTICFRSIIVKANKSGFYKTFGGSKMDDNKIIELYWGRNEDAITQTKECYGQRLNALAYRILQSREDAEECENDTYMKAWDSIPPQKPQHFFAYLAKICRNTALKMAEKQKAEKRSAVIVELSQELAECLPDKHSLEDSAEQELGEIISEFLKTVSKENRIIFIRRYFLSETISDISKALLISESKVKSSLFRTRNKLRDYLSKEELL